MCDAEMMKQADDEEAACNSVGYEARDPLTLPVSAAATPGTDHSAVPASHSPTTSTCCSRITSCITPCLKSSHLELTEYDRLSDRIIYAFLCPPHGRVARLLLLTLGILLLWGVVWAVCANVGLQYLALPGGHLYALIVFTVLCVIAGWLVTFIKLPPLLGMLVMGVALRNVPGVNIGSDLDPQWSSLLRAIALVVILTRAGLGLDADALMKLKFVMIRLAFLPCLAEALSVGVLTHLIMDFPWLWGFMLGFVLAAVSPAVVVPCMLRLQERRYGTSLGIPTLVIAAASIDDVLAIGGFGVLLGITFSTGDVVFNVFRGPLEVFLGLLYGCVAGVVMWYLPPSPPGAQTTAQGPTTTAQGPTTTAQGPTTTAQGPSTSTRGPPTSTRVCLLLASGVFVSFSSRVLEFSGAGALATLSQAFVAGYGWRIRGGSESDDVCEVMRVLWIIFQPLLFGLIGAQIDISKLDGDTIGYGVLVLTIGLTIRMLTSFLAVCGVGLPLKVKLFIPFAWLPKATVQAAIGSWALDTARERGAGEEAERLGTQVLTIAVLVILITAPLGAALITVLAPRLLPHDGISSDTAPSMLTQRPSTPSEQPLKLSQQPSTLSEQPSKLSQQPSTLSAEQQQQGRHDGSCYAIDPRALPMAEDAV